MPNFILDGWDQGNINNHGKNTPLVTWHSVQEDNNTMVDP